MCNVALAFFDSGIFAQKNLTQKLLFFTGMESDLTLSFSYLSSDSSSTKKF